MSSSDKLKIPLQEILSATNGFAEANIIGKGGYGLVYRGQSKQHGMLAIKRLNRVHSGQGEHEYGMEVSLLSKYKHKNLVSLIGYCGEGGEKILVYKYEANQSLDKFLHSKDLSWTRRLNICLGAARGLRFLHNETGSEHVVIHRDIKSSNILLDENWNAKISDFGLSKLALTNSANSIVFSMPCGTRGYIDPQARVGELTQKSDVYSFGVVMYEVLFGKLVADLHEPSDGHFSVKMAKKHYEEKTLHMMINPYLKKEMHSDSLGTFSTIAYQCLKERTKDRPTMSLVAEAIEKALGYQQVISTRKSIGSSSSGYKYDVYVSFKVGMELLVGYMFDALDRERLSFYNNVNLYGGQPITRSRSFIIIFSKRYGSDYCNLNEVAEIIECVKERNSVVIPVFWDVHPSEVKRKNGYIREAMSIFKSQGIWRDALIKTTNAIGLQTLNSQRDSQSLAKEAVGRIKYQLLGGKERNVKEHEGKESKGKEREGKQPKGKAWEGEEGVMKMKEKPNQSPRPPFIPFHHVTLPFTPYLGPGVRFPSPSPSPSPYPYPPHPLSIPFVEQHHRIELDQGRQIKISRTIEWSFGEGDLSDPESPTL